MRNKQDFYPGQICLFDRYNFTNLKGKNSVLMVSIVRPYYDSKYKLFKNKDLWICFVPMTQEMIVVHESLLCPAPTVEQMRDIESIIMIRNPVNLPEISINDVNSLKDSIDIIEAYKKLISNDDTITIRRIENVINGINKLLLKFKFYSRMIVQNNPINLGRISSIPMEDNMQEQEEYDEDDV